MDGCTNPGRWYIGVTAVWSQKVTITQSVTQGKELSFVLLTCQHIVSMPLIIQSLHLTLVQELELVLQLV
jgi:hypothetical protein